MSELLIENIVKRNPQTMKEFIDNLKNNPEQRKKIIIAGVLFLFFVVGAITVILTSGDKRTKEEKKTESNNIEGSHIHGDSIAVNTTDKQVVYQMGTENTTQSDAIINDGLNASANGETRVSDDAELDNYLRRREQSIANASSGSNRRASYRRSYNPNGNSSDWTSVNTATTVRASSEPVLSQNDINNDITAYENSRGSRNKISQPVQPSLQPQTIPVTQSQALNAKEQRRMMLRTGKKDFSNTNNIKINIDGTQYVKNGGSVKLKLMQDAVINNNYFPKYTILYGTTRFADGRVNISVNSVKGKDSIIPCNLEGYGSDGQQGVAVNINAISGLSSIVQGEIDKEIASLSSTTVGNIVTRLFNTRRKNEIKIKLLNNLNLLFIQQ